MHEPRADTIASESPALTSWVRGTRNLSMLVAAMKTRYLSRLFLLGILAATNLLAQTRAERNQLFPAHKVIGNLYFVGTANLGSFLITTPQGNILINSDYEETVPIVRA